MRTQHGGEELRRHFVMLLVGKVRQGRHFGIAHVGHERLHTITSAFDIARMNLLQALSVQTADSGAYHAVGDQARFGPGYRGSCGRVHCHVVLPMLFNQLIPGFV
jgi:hypothetical protein